MVLEPMMFVAVVFRRFQRAWLSEDVSEASLASVSLMITAIFLVGVGFLAARFDVDRLGVSAAALGFIGVLLGAPALISRLGFQPEVYGRRRIALANSMRAVARRWYLLLLAGSLLIASSIALLELRRVGYVLPLLIVQTITTLGLFAISFGVVTSLLPRRLVVPLPSSVEILSPLRLVELPRGEAIAGLAAITCFAVAELLQLADACIH